ncbi:MAG: lipoyl synthase [Myxococcota bacterium]
MRPHVSIDALRQTRGTRLPSWLKVRVPGSGAFGAIREKLRALELHTVCEEARCPNLAECWGGGTATIMVLGDTCTRACRFCHVKSGNPRGVVDAREPEHVGEAVAAMGLRYVVLTSVDRDDLADGGAGHFAACVRSIKRRAPEILVETLVPDFGGNDAALAALLCAAPDVVAQNQETVRRLTRTVRDRRADYDLTLRVLAAAKRLSPRAITKSSLMVGLGERDGEIAEAMGDLRAAGVEILTIGQYLRPSKAHLPVAEFVPPERFDAYRLLGESLGFAYVASGPLVRSSYRAGELFIEAKLRSRPRENDGSRRPEA